jgi:hypothetical protein
MFMVVNGHVLGDGTGRLVSEGVNGNKVYQMMSNYQMRNKGEGFLRIIDINPENETMEVISYSPYRNEYLTDPDQQFVYHNVVLTKPK